MGIRDCSISPRSPWQNGIAERLIGTLRRECLTSGDLQRDAPAANLSAYAAYYNQARTHGITERCALHRAVQRSGAIFAIDLADLHHQYVRYDFRKDRTVFGCPTWMSLVMVKLVADRPARNAVAEGNRARPSRAFMLSRSVPPRSRRKRRAAATTAVKAPQRIVSKRLCLGPIRRT
jgi:transposase InsO family protein